LSPVVVRARPKTTRAVGALAGIGQTLWAKILAVVLPLKLL
jgi:hypothetical protein